MKKLRFLIIAIALLTVFYACQKDPLGVYNPKMKIEKVYHETDSHYLLEQWTWNGNLLSKIDYYRPSGNLYYTHTYLYDEKNRLSRIETDDQYTEFLYDGNLLTTINTYVHDKLVEIYHLTYDKKKLSHITIEKPSKGAPDVVFLPFFVPGNADMVEAFFPTRDSKAEAYNFSSAEMDYVWEGDNVQYLKMRIARPDSTQRLTFSYIYEESLNPKNGFLTLLTDHALLTDEPQYILFSKNNATSVMVTDEYDVFSQTKSFTYSYNCYKKYPTKIYATTLNKETWEEDSTLIYTYVYLY